MQDAWASVYPSYYEGYGLPVSESVAAGVPVLCGQGGALKERVAEGGCMATGGDTVEDWVDGLQGILQEGQRLKLAKECGSIKIRSWQEVGEELLRVLKKYER